MLVLGGGIGGLSAAYYLVKNGAKSVSVMEASKAVGGWIRTVVDPRTGLYFEKGPRTLRVKNPAGANTLSLIEEIGIADKVQPISADHPSAKNRMIYVNGGLHLLPSSWSSLFKKTPPFSKILLFNFLKDVVVPPKLCDDDNVYDFVERRLGKELADYLISAMICGICAGDSKQISVKFLMPQLFDMEQKEGAIWKGFLKSLKNLPSKNSPKKESEPICSLNEKAKKENWSIIGLQDGMCTLPEALHESIVKSGVKVNVDAKVSKLKLKASGVEYELNNSGKIEHCEHVISSIPARNLAPLLKEQHPQLALDLSSIPFVSVAVVNLAFPGKVLSKEAFGFLIPPSQNIPILGVVFDSCNFSQGDWTVLSVMMGGAWMEKYYGSNPKQEQLYDTALKFTKDILKITVDPVINHTAVMEQCIPQYVVGHQERISRIFSYVQDKSLPLSLIGASYKGIGVNEVVLSASHAARSLTRPK